MTRFYSAATILFLLLGGTAGVITALYALAQNSGMPRWTTIEPSVPAIRHLLFTPDGKHLLVGGDGLDHTKKGGQWEGDLSIWDVTTKKIENSIRLPHWIRSLSLIRKGDLLAVSCGCTGTKAKVDKLGYKPIPGEVR